MGENAHACFASLNFIPLPRCLGLPCLRQVHCRLLAYAQVLLRPWGVPVCQDHADCCTCITSFAHHNRDYCYLQVHTKSGEGNGTPLQYSCLGNPMDGGAWWAAVHVVPKSRTRLSNFTFMHWRRKWQPTPVFLPGESQGREPGGCRLWGHTESDTTEGT